MAKITEEPDYRERTFIFRDRSHAGYLLAEKLKQYSREEDVLVLAVPSGGVPVGCIVARELNLSIDVIVVRKVQIPWNPEAGFGALSWDGEIVLNAPLIERLGLTTEIIDEQKFETEKVIRERLRTFRGDMPLPELTGKTVILVDDGLASGFTMLAAAKSVRKKKPQRIIVAVPTASLRAIELLINTVNEIVCLNIRSGPIFAVADAYENWYDLTSEEVIEILEDLP